MLWFAAVSIVVLVPQSHAQLQVCNGTVRDGLRVAIVWNKEGVGRVVRGWWVLSPGACTQVHGGDAGLLSKDLWIYGEYVKRTPLIIWNQRPKCAAGKAFFNILQLVGPPDPTDPVFSDCGTSEQHEFCVRSNMMPDYPSDVLADPPAVGCEESSRFFVHAPELKGNTAKLSLIYYGGQEWITSSDHNPVMTLSHGSLPWGFGGIDLGVLVSGEKLAGCDANQSPPFAPPHKPDCDNDGFWTTPDRENFEVCTYNGREKPDNGKCVPSLSPDRRTITAHCHANEKANFGGGGHAYWFLDSVTVTSDPRYCQ
jgi:hypothetical protein